MPVLAATLTTAIVFFPVIFLYGVSRFLFTALALAVVLSLVASYFVAMTVVPLFCARLIKAHQLEAHEIEVQDILPDDSSAHTTLTLPPLPQGMAGWGRRFNQRFNHFFTRMLDRYRNTLASTLLRPAATVVGITGIFVLSLGLYPLIGKAYFPRTDPASS